MWLELDACQGSGEGRDGVGDALEREARRHTEPPAAASIGSGRGMKGSDLHFQCAPLGTVWRVGEGGEPSREA